jgi:hypothetical protein
LRQRLLQPLKPRIRPAAVERPEFTG